jgi:hypothetical protein
MGTVKVNVPDEDEEVFREVAMDVFGHKRGSISDAAAQAFREWAERRRDLDLNLSDGLGTFLRENAVESDKSAVELQEELGAIYEEQVD